MEIYCLWFLLNGIHREKKPTSRIYFWSSLRKTFIKMPITAFYKEPSQTVINFLCHVHIWTFCLRNSTGSHAWLCNYFLEFILKKKSKTPKHKLALKLIFLVAYILVVRGLETVSGFCFLLFYFYYYFIFGLKSHCYVWRVPDTLCFALGRPAEGAWVRKQTLFPDLFWNLTIEE